MIRAHEPTSPTQPASDTLLLRVNHLLIRGYTIVRTYFRALAAVEAFVHELDAARLLLKTVYFEDGAERGEKEGYE